MSSPPPYDTIASSGWREVKSEETKSQQRWNIREVVAASRTNHVASIVEQLLPEIKSRAQKGYAKTELILIPSDQDDARKGQLVGVEQDVPALIIQFEGSQNTTAFWSQVLVVAELQKQLTATVSVDETVIEVESPSRPEAQGYGSSWLSRRKQKQPLRQTVAQEPKEHPVSVSVIWDDLHSRSESEYGLFETKRAKAVFIVIDVR